MADSGSSFLGTATSRSLDVEFDTAISDRIVSECRSTGRLWRVELRGAVGRTLVAARDIPAGVTVFTEVPLVVGLSTNTGSRTLRGSTPAVAIELLRSHYRVGPARLLQQQAASATASVPQTSDDLSMRFERRLSRASAFDAWVRDFLTAIASPSRLVCMDGSPIPCTIPAARWALGVAFINTHAARDEPSRGVLGLLSSMMEHSCVPSAEVNIAPWEAGSLVSLRTRRAVSAGEALSIAYVSLDWTAVERRNILAVQYGFECRCGSCLLGPPATNEVVDGRRDGADTLANACDGGQHKESSEWEPFLPQLLKRGNQSAQHQCDRSHGEC